MTRLRGLLLPALIALGLLGLLFLVPPGMAQITPTAKQAPPFSANYLPLVFGAEPSPIPSSTAIVPTTTTTLIPTSTAVGATPSPQPTATATPTRAAAPSASPTRDPTQCSPSYPTVCIPPPPPDLNCDDIPYRNFTVLPPDPHKFDTDNDGIGCESR